jgi:hypothetical protein
VELQVLAGGSWSISREGREGKDFSLRFSLRPSRDPQNFFTPCHYPPAGPIFLPGKAVRWPGERDFPSGKSNFPSGKPVCWPGKDVCLAGKANFPSGKHDFPSGKRVCPAGKDDFPRGKDVCPSLPMGKKPGLCT